MYLQPFLVKVNKGVLYSFKNINKLFLSSEDYFGSTVNEDIQFYDIILVDIKEKPVEGDLIYYCHSNPPIIGTYHYDKENNTYDIITESHQIYPFSSKEYFFKVVASTSNSHKIQRKILKTGVNGGLKKIIVKKELPKLSLKSIQYLIDCYNKTSSIPESIEVEENQSTEKGCAFPGVYFNSLFKSKLKLNRQREIDIIIPKIEENEKVYTEKEVLEMFNLFIKTLGKAFSEDLLEESNFEIFSINWFNQNKKK